MIGKTAFPIDVNITKYKIAMQLISTEALPKSIAETLNRTAEAVTKQQIKNVKKDMIIRSKFTLKSMEAKGARPWRALNKARGNIISRMFSRAGTFSNYLWMQEDNFTKEGLSGPIPIPTLKARISKSIKKSVRKDFRLKPGQSLSDGELGDNMFIGTPRGLNKRGLYLRGPRAGQLTMLRNLESNEAKIKGTGFHSKAVARFGTQQFIKAQFLKVSKRILKRKGLQ